MKKRRHVIMTKSKNTCLFWSIFFFIFSITIIGIIPFRVINPKFVLFGDSLYNYIFSIIMTFISFYLFMKFKVINNILIRYLFLFLMVYFVLVFSSNCVFDFTLTKLLNYFETNSLTKTKEYAQLWDIWSNDLSRNAMYFLGIFYSILAVTIYLSTMLLKAKFKK